MKSHLSRTDLKRILNNWNGTFQITKQHGRIVAVNVSKSVILNDFNDIAELKQKIEASYLHKIFTSVKVVDSKYELVFSIKITNYEFADFLRVKSKLNEVQIA